MQTVRKDNLVEIMKGITINKDDVKDYTGDFPAWCGVKEMNKRTLNISDSYFYRLVNHPEAPKIKVGNRILLNTKLFLEWLEVIAKDGFEIL